MTQSERSNPRLAFILKKVCERYRDGQIIDVGCGRGNITREIGKLGVPILGIDPDGAEIQTAIRNSTFPNVEFKCAEIGSIESQQYTGVILADVLEHVEDPEGLLSEIDRISTHDAFLILTVPNGYCPTEIVFGILRRLKRFKFLEKIIVFYKRMTIKDTGCNESPHIQQFSMRRLEAMLSTAGFTIEEASFMGLWSSFLRWFFPFLPRPVWLGRFERWLGTYLPYYALSHWRFALSKCKEREHL